MISCIVVDDEPRAHVVLENYIGRLEHVCLKSTFKNAISAFEYLRTNATDLLLLDINMPEIDGFMLLQMLERPPMTIFTTGHTEYALKSYEWNAIDYLHKPIRFERFVKAIEKAERWKQAETNRRKEPYIEVRIDGNNRQIKTDNIIYIESMGNYVKIFCKDKIFITMATLKDMEYKLSDSSFLRIHKSYIVNMDMHVAIENDQLTVKDKILPIGKTYKNYIRSKLSTYLRL